MVYGEEQKGNVADTANEPIKIHTSLRLFATRWWPRGY